MKIKFLYWVSIVFILFFLNYFYCLFLVTKGEVNSFIYQVFLIFIFFFVSLSTIIFKFQIKKKYLFLLFLSLPAFVSSFFYIGFLESISYITTTLLLPILFISIVSTQLVGRNQMDKHILFKLFIYYFLLRALVYLALIPLELVSSDKLGFHNLQFTGGQYHNVAIMFLLYMNVNFLNREHNNLYHREKYLVLIMLCFTVLFSFSRVGIILLFTYFLFNFIFFEKNKFKFISVLVLFLLLCYNFFNLEENLFTTFWQNRLNIDLDNLTSIQFSTIFNQEGSDDVRGLIREMGLKRNIFQFFFGTGIGTTPEYLFEISKGIYRFSSFHNFFLTILFERGILIFFLILIYFLNLIYKLIKLNLLRSNVFLIFLLFIIFITTTGADLFLNSRDFNIDMFLCLLFTDTILINSYKLFQVE